MRDINKEVNVIKCDKPIICNKCQTAHQIFFHEDIYSSFCEIPTLSDDKSIIYLHEISYEYANGFDNSFIDYITEILLRKKIALIYITNQLLIEWHYFI